MAPKFQTLQRFFSLLHKQESLRNVNNYTTKCIVHEPKPRSLQNNRTGKASKTKHKDEANAMYMRNTINNIYKILKYSSWDSAKSQLLNLGIKKWDSYTINQVLKTHPPMEKAWLFFNWASTIKGFKHDHFTYTTMMDIFGEAKRIESMKYVFNQMKEKGVKIDAVTYTSFMHWISNAGDVDAAIKVWVEMRGSGCYPTVVSYTAFMKVLFDNGRLKEASDVYKEMIEDGVSPNCRTYTVLMEFLIGDGKWQEALEIFSNMQEAGEQPDKAACNILIEKCCKVGETRAINEILQYMKVNRIVLRYPVYREALKALRLAGESDALLRLVNPHCNTEDIVDSTEHLTNGTDDVLENGLVLMLLKKKSLGAVDYLLVGLSDKHIPLYSWIVSAVVEANCDSGRPDGALLAFEYSMKLGIDLDRVTYLSLIGVLIRSSTFPKVTEIAKKIIMVGHSLGTYLCAILIYRLGHARQPKCAAKIFELIPDDQKCVATYTALIAVYFHAGSAEKALKIYKNMRRNRLQPCLGTYNVLLAGLEKSGRSVTLDAYKKEKKSFTSDGYCRNTLSMEQNICDLLFSGYSGS